MEKLRQTAPTRLAAVDGSSEVDAGRKDAVCAVLVGIDASGIVSVRLNQPEVFNCLDQDMLGAFDAALESCERNHSARVLLLSAAGKHFSAGANIRQLRGSRPKVEGAAPGRSLPQVLQRLKALPIPTVAVVQGGAIGGGAALAACADIVVAEKNAFFAIPEVRLGIPPAALIPFFVAAIGERQTRRWVLTGDRFGAEEAARWGLVHLMCEVDQLDETAARVAASLVDGGPNALAATKRLIGESGPTQSAGRLADLERITLDHLASPEGAEGIAAYLEKRAPRWQPRTICERPV